MKTVPTAPSRSNSGRFLIALWLVITQVLSLLSLVIWYVIASYALSGLEEGVTVSGVVLTGLIWLYPLFPLAVLVFSWRAFRQQKNLLAAVITVLPLLVPPVAVLLAFPPGSEETPFQMIQTPVQNQTLAITAPPLTTQSPGLTAEIQAEMNNGQVQGDEIIAAIENYDLGRGVYPNTLEDLVPAYLAEIPVTATGQAFWYEQNATDLYVLGFDLATRPGASCWYARRLVAWQCNLGDSP